MAGSLNKVTLIGNVGRTPEVRFSSDGGKILNFSVATNESWKDKTSGERKDKTEWHRIVVFNDRLADVIEKYVRKGSKVYIEGQLQTRKWTDQSGVERYITEIVLGKFRGEILLLDSKDSASSYEASSSSDRAYGETSQNQQYNDAEFLDDEIPFS